MSHSRDEWVAGPTCSMASWHDVTPRRASTQGWGGSLNVFITSAYRTWVDMSGIMDRESYNCKVAHREATDVSGPVKEAILIPFPLGVPQLFPVGDGQFVGPLHPVVAGRDSVSSDPIKEGIVKLQSDQHFFH